MDKKIYAFTDQEHAVIKVALGALAAVLEHPHPAKQVMQALMLMAAPDLKDPARHVDRLLDGQGLDIGEVVNILGAPEGDPYVAAAENHSLVYSGKVELDGRPIVCEGEGGAQVMCWLWVSNEAAGGDPEDDDEPA